jgi:hypothetical protein
MENEQIKLNVQKAEDLKSKLIGKVIEDIELDGENYFGFDTNLNNKAIGIGSITVSGKKYIISSYYECIISEDKL